MRFLSTIKKRAEEGFTLVEILIIAPVVIIVISGFIALIITMVGDVLAIRDRNNMAFEIRNTLDRIEQDTRLSTQFLTTSNTLLSPQGSDNNFTGTAAFSNTNSLILGTLTTDKNPTDTTRQLVFYAKQPNDCGPQQSYNRPFISKTMYFIKNGSLWRRSYLFNWNQNATPNDETLCSAPWQQNSCSPGYTASRCQTNDVEMMQNVSSFSVKYYATPQSTTDIGAINALSATSIEVTINGQKTIAGRSVTNAGTVRAAKINNIDADLAAPTTPTVSSTVSGPNTITFSWPAVPAATSYNVSYNINGGSWVNATNDSTTTSFSVNAYRNDTVTIQVSARNSTGTSAADQEAATLPLWTDCDLKNGWVNYSPTPGYSGAAYTKTNNDIVVLKGMIKSGTVTDGTTVCTLPPGLRPAYPQIFQNSSPDSASRIDVWPDGNVTISNANAGWVSLENIRFVASTASYTWTNLTLSNGWTNFGSPYPPALQYTTDTVGRVIVRGMIVQGTFADQTLIAALPASKQPSQYLIFPARGGSGFNALGINYAAGRGIESKGGINPNGWYSPQAIYYPSSFAGWSSLTFQNSWSNFGSGFTTAQYTKASDGLVTIKGIIKGGTSSGTLPVAQLPAGYRPKEKVLVHTISAAGYSRLDIDTDGKIYPVIANTTYTGLDGISFMGDQ
ncbi:MAG TPA: fibronectin type III domain-containing protein [Candidatus Saccharimonadales bacterium]|nr:fibronectin type III domain-containing protein [Candidatus Saccharimonadales bacterium]